MCTYTLVVGVALYLTQMFWVGTCCLSQIPGESDQLPKVDQTDNSPFYIRESEERSRGQPMAMCKMEIYDGSVSSLHCIQCEWAG